MRLRFAVRYHLILAAALIAAGIAELAGQATLPRAILIVGGTLIDGTGAAPRRNAAILLDGGHITAIGPDAEKRAPKDARRLDATGKWILPGLIDAHIHLFQSGGLDARPDVVPAPLPAGRTYNDVVTDIQRHPEPYLRAYLCAGITSVVDMGGPRWEFVLRDRADRDLLLPRMAFAGPLLMTGSGGGGRAAGPSPLNLQDEAFWGVSDEVTARQQVERLAGYRPEVVKVVFMARDAADLAAKTKVVSAIVAASHAVGLRVAVHATTLETAMASVQSGADMLVHSVADREVSDEFVNAVVSRHVMVSPTLVVNKMYREALSGRTSIDPFERKCAPANTVQSFDALPSLNIHRERADDSAVQKKNLKRLADAGTMIYAGSDAGNTRTLHGPSLHQELAMMVDAGLSPMAVLVAATGSNARMMGREKEVGQIAAGMLADVLLLDADPLADIHNTQRIFKVIRGGEFYDR